MKKIRIRIGRDGKATISVEGVQGPSCLDLTKAFEQAIGEVQERRLCKEYHEEVSEQATEQSKETI
jgi:hypothetical protein